MHSMIRNNQSALVGANSSGNRSLLTTSQATLSQLKGGLDALTHSQYLGDPDNNASVIGKHVRHIIEFYQALFDYSLSGENAVLCYDKRQRNLRLESSKDFAVQELNSIKAKLPLLGANNLEVELCSIIVPGEPMMHIQSSLHRELFYLLDHTIHHMALIKMLAEQQGVLFERSFGLAQSTKAHESNNL